MSDDDLIEALRDAMRADTCTTEVPDRIADHARRTARRRTARRVVAAGAPLLTGVAVALVLATRTEPDRTSPRSADAPRVTAGQARVGQGQAHDTAFIVRAVKADVAGDRRHGIVTYGTDYSRGHVSPSGAAAGLGRRLTTGYRYTAPSGAVFWRFNSYDDHGTAVFEESDDWTPTVDGRYTWTRLLINTTSRTYSEHEYRVRSLIRPEPGANIERSPSQVRRALQDGRVTQKGTTVIRGVRSITLSVALPKNRRLLGDTLTLYVNARTYEPLRTVFGTADRDGLEIEEWLPASAHNITLAKDDSIPAGYSRVARAY
ncbi:MAG TPA: hypothetical protein VGG07_12550 [Solirubrobacteraceae bacterium]|jgi:hypothetical protein